MLPNPTRPSTWPPRRWIERSARPRSPGRSRAAHGQERVGRGHSGGVRVTPTPFSSPMPSCPASCCASSPAARRSPLRSRRRQHHISAASALESRSLCAGTIACRKCPITRWRCCCRLRVRKCRFQQARAVRFAGRCRRSFRSIVSAARCSAWSDSATSARAGAEAKLFGLRVVTHDPYAAAGTVLAQAGVEGVGFDRARHVGFRPIHAPLLPATAACSRHVFRQDEAGAFW